MSFNLDEKEIAVLECLAASNGAIGSWNLVDMMAERGFDFSPTTAGRILRRLEGRKYVSKVSNTGREITKAGYAALANARNISTINEHQEKLREMITACTLENYITVLQARRAVERESARLAAIYITDEELAHLDEVLDEQSQYNTSGRSIAELDVEFHRSIAHASRNQVLESMYQMLFSYGQQTPLFEQIRSKRKRAVNSAHYHILDALHEHDSKKAEKMMMNHIDSLISDVNEYIQKAEKTDE